MDNHSYAYDEPEVEINLVDVLWNLLGQWKAVLIVAVIMALAIPGLKLTRDTKAYQAAQAVAAEEKAALANIPADEAIQQALNKLPAEDRDAIQTLVSQQELVNTQSTYLQNSLALSLDPANQRTLYVRYLLTADDGVEVAPLGDAYMALLRKDSTIRELGDIIDPEAELSYVYELINLSYSTVPDSYANEIMITVSVVLPQDADADPAVDVVDARMQEICAQLQETVGGHSIAFFDRNELYTYNEVAVNRKAAIVASINSNKAALKTAVAALTADQKAAFDSIVGRMGAENSDGVSGVEDEAEATGNAAALTPPSFSIKFAAVGFVVGAVLYAIGYVVIIMIRGRVGSAEELADYTHTRSLGDVYYPVRHKGLSKLFHSNLVSKRRYGSKGDVATQIAKTTSTIDSVCEHAGVSTLHVLHMGSDHGAGASMARDIVAALAAKGVQAQVAHVAADVDEKELLSIKNAIYYVGDDVKSSDVWKLSTLCRSYDIQQLGSVFVKSW